MNKRFISTIIFAGNVIVFTACNQSNPTEQKEASVVTTTTTTTTGGTTSGTEMGTTGQAHQQSFMMKTMQNTMNEMKQMKMTGDPDYDFATMMVKHHQAGMEMANHEISKGTNQELVTLAKKIKQEQEADIKELQTFLSKSTPGKQNQAFLNEVKKNMQTAESNMNNMTMKGNPDQDFAMAMSMLHQNGIKMAEAETKYGMNQKIKTMAQKTMENQKKEMKQLDAFAGKKQGM